ncbi:MAG: gliding motility lipoprotein GldD [Bacteroidetes bacterium]|nr:gliding motility lipoprotein GldD [Bacteroidota bacterium]
MCINYRIIFYAFFVVIGFGAVSCDEEEEIFSPKPRGYFRINFPEKEYRLYDSICPYKFEIPVYAVMKQDKHNGADPCWLNLEFPKYRATVHLSYKVVNNDIGKYLEDAHEFANKHQVKATGLDEIAVLRDSAKVYGLVFDIAGNTASSVQFYLTDSTHHFLRGALYFNSVPNIDSLRIVVDFIKKDILHLINTTSWKNEVPEGLNKKTEKVKS